MSSIITIDPGVEGGMCHWADGRPTALFEYPGREDLRSKLEYIGRYWGGALVVIEKVHGSPVMGPGPAFTFGQNYGEWIGMLAMIACKPMTLAPVQWQRPWADELAGLQGDKRKSELNRIAKRLYAAEIRGGLRVNLMTCDALLMAHYLVDCIKNGRPHGAKLLE